MNFSRKAISSSGLIFALAVFLIFQIESYSETIYTKDGRQIKAGVIDKLDKQEGFIQYYAKDAGTGALNAYRIDISEIKEILNDDGSVSKYSPTYCEPCAKKAKSAEKDK